MKGQSVQRPQGRSRAGHLRKHKVVCMVGTEWRRDKVKEVMQTIVRSLVPS